MDQDPTRTTWEIAVDVVGVLAIAVLVVVVTALAMAPTLSALVGGGG